MEPLKPEDIENIIQQRPDVTRDDIDEYQRLLGEHFLKNPLTETPEESQHRLLRIHELYHKIFGYAIKEDD